MTPRLELRSVSKRYPGVVANKDICLAIMPGQIHAVLGENGAGKSTLMKIIYGSVAADSGELYSDGKRIERHNPAISRMLGIAMVYQHFALFDSVSVAENIALATKGACDLVTLSHRIAKLSKRYGMPIDPRRYVHELSVGERQRVEIVRCLLQNPKLLILDEPTSVLTPQAVQRLFETLRQIAAEGCSILYISHKLEEVRTLCHSATILRNGQVAGEVNPRKTPLAELARLMVGSNIPQVHAENVTPNERPALEVRNLSAPARDRYGVDLSSISFEVHGGEIVGVAGISGNGQTELMALLSGEQVASQADVIVINGKPCSQLGAAERRNLGLTFVPEQRLGHGAVPSHTLWQNIVLTSHSHGIVRGGLVDRATANAKARAIIEAFRVKASGPLAHAQSLSGGNLQKFIVGREIALKPKVLLISQPTWGVDVGAAAFIRQTLIDLSRTGVAILVVSEELDELFEICDRMLVIRSGRISRPLLRAATSREEIGMLMTDQGNG